jgi:hypothetical protein
LFLLRYLNRGIGALTFAECRARLTEKLERLAQYNVKVNRNKSKFFQQRVKYICYIITGRGIEPNPERVRAVVDAPVPVDVTQLKSFLGLMNNYTENYLSLIFRKINDFVHRFI